MNPLIIIFSDYLLKLQFILIYFKSNRAQISNQNFKVILS